MSEDNINLDFGFLKQADAPKIIMSEQGTPYIQCGTFKGLPLGAIVQIHPYAVKEVNMNSAVPALLLIVKIQVKFEDWQRDSVVANLNPKVKARLRPNHISVVTCRVVTVYSDTVLALKCIFKQLAEDVGAELFDLDSTLSLMFEQTNLKNKANPVEDNIYGG